MKREMTKEEIKEIKTNIHFILAKAVSEDYAKDILEREDDTAFCKTIEDEIIEDIITSSAWEEESYYNDDDIKLAIGRVLISKLDKIYN